MRAASVSSPLSGGREVLRWSRGALAAVVALMEPATFYLAQEDEAHHEGAEHDAGLRDRLAALGEPWPGVAHRLDHLQPGAVLQAHRQHRAALLERGHVVPGGLQPVQRPRRGRERRPYVRFGAGAGRSRAGGALRFLAGGANAIGGARAGGR